MGKGKKILIVLAVIILAFIIIVFGINNEFDKQGEPYATSTLGLDIAEASEVLDLKDGDTLNLSIDIVKKEIAGQTVKMFGYNGQIPGPLLKIAQNSAISVNVVNNLDVETTVHWHGLRLDNKFDGVPGISMETQQPGESFQYELKFTDEGIYWYHPHVREDYQQEMGLYGNMLVAPVLLEFFFLSPLFTAYC